MINVKETVEILLEDKNLYKECGDLFKYLSEVKINMNNIEYHNASWLFGQIIEIVYSNKLNNINLNVFDVITAQATAYFKNTKEKLAVRIGFDTTIMASNYRRSHKLLTVEVLELIRSNVWKLRKEKNYQPINYVERLNETNLRVLEALLNGTYSNNPLYFLPVFICLIYYLFKNDKYSWIIIGQIINLYLMKNQLIFAPTLPWSYPLLYNLSDFKRIVDSVTNNPAAIKKLSVLVNDIIKQASVISRALVSTSTLIYSEFENRVNKNKVIKQLSEYDYKNILKVLAFDKKVFEKVLKLPFDVQPVLDELKKVGLIKVIYQSNENEVYMFKNFLTSIKKLDKNKSEKTTKIFVLNENLS